MEGKETKAAIVRAVAPVQLCPLGCLCCIMQQFYNRKCWCMEVKESIGVQTDPPEHDPRDQADFSGKKKIFVSMATQTDPEDLSTLEDAWQGVTKDNISKESLQETSSEPIIEERLETGAFQYLNRINLGNTLIPKHKSKKKYKRRFPVSSQSPYSKLVSKFEIGETSTDLRQSEVIEGQSNVNSEDLVLCVARNHDDDVKDIDTEFICKKYFSHGGKEYSHMQNVMGQLVDEYDLQGARDVNFEIALDTLFGRFPDLADDISTRKTVRDKLRHKISSRRHYSRMKSEADTMGVGVSYLKKQIMKANFIKNKLIGENTIKNSIQNQSMVPSKYKIHQTTLDIKSPALDLSARKKPEVQSLPPPEKNHSMADDCNTIQIKTEPVDD